MLHPFKGLLENAKGPPHSEGPFERMSGGVLLSHEVPLAVPSALRGLASGFGMEPGVSLPLWPPKLYGDINLNRARSARGSRPNLGNRIVDAKKDRFETSPRPISTGQLHALLHFHIRPINPVIYWGPYQVNPVGVLILERVSRLDAFSGYPYRT